MLFNSADFLLFFPLVLIIYYILPCKVRQIWLLGASYFFYMNWNMVYGWLLFAVTLLSYLGARGIERYGEKEGIKKIIFTMTLIVNLGALAFFKYMDFISLNINRLFRFLPGGGIKFRWEYNIILPVGISFYVLQSVGYMIDVYRGEERAERNFLRYALFVSFFPQLVAGPIERSKNLLNQLKTPQKLTWENCKRGVWLILWGYFLKLVIADRAAIFVDAVYEQPESYKGVYILVATFLFSIQIYCDFNGYSTIARGVALCFGIRLMDNFNAPYLAMSVSEFWRRWHISLTGWFRDYLYIPLGGNRKGEKRKQLNRLFVFGVSGLWHGASFSYIVWGILNALFQSAGDIKEKSKKRMRSRFPGLLSAQNTFSIRLGKRVITFLLISFTWIFFRTGDMSDALELLRYAVEPNWIVFFNGALYKLGIQKDFFHVLLLAIAVMFAVDHCKYQGRDVPELLSKQQWWFQSLILLCLVFAILLFGCYGMAYDAAQFIYFQF